MGTKQRQNFSQTPCQRIPCSQRHLGEEIVCKLQFSSVVLGVYLLNSGVWGWGKDLHKQNMPEECPEPGQCRLVPLLGSRGCCCWMDPGAIRFPRAMHFKGKEMVLNYVFSWLFCWVWSPNPFGKGNSVLVFIVGLHEWGIFVCSAVQHALFLTAIILVNVGVWDSHLSSFSSSLGLDIFFLQMHPYKGLLGETAIGRALFHHSPGQLHDILRFIFSSHCTHF